MTTPRAAAFPLLLLLLLLPAGHGFVVPPSAPLMGPVTRATTTFRKEWDGSDLRQDSGARWRDRVSRTILHDAQRDASDESTPSSPPPPPSSSLRVGIVGAGSVAFGTASLAASRGHRPAAWSPSGAGTAELLERGAETETGGEGDLSVSEIQSTGELSHGFDVRIAVDAGELVRGSDGAVVLALPVNGHKQVLEELAPHIVDYVMERRQNQEEADPVSMHVIISSHASLGAVYLMKLLREERRRYLSRNDAEISSADDNDIGVRITAWGTTAVTARKTSGTSVNVLTLRKAVDICTVPSTREDSEEMERSTTISASGGDILADGYHLCTALFGERFRIRAGGLLAISLSNLNPQNHLGIVLGNMSRMDPPPPPPPPPGFESSNPPDTRIEPWHQGKNITPNVGRLMEALDQERLAIAAALDIEVRTIYQHFSWSFHVPLETPVPGGDAMQMRPLTVSEMNQQMHHYLDNDVLGPSTPDSRYVLEDVPYGLALTVVLGRLIGRPATLHEASIAIMSAMYGRNFLGENELLVGMGILDAEGRDGEVPALEAWREMAYKGCFED